MAYEAHTVFLEYYRQPATTRSLVLEDCSSFPKSELHKGMTVVVSSTVFMRYIDSLCSDYVTTTRNILFPIKLGDEKKVNSQFERIERKKQKRTEAERLPETSSDHLKIMGKSEKAKNVEGEGTVKSGDQKKETFKSSTSP